MNQSFLTGAATAAHQVEGNNRNSDNWVMEHLPHTTFVEPSGDAVDHYHRYESDIQMLADAGCNAYRFSIEWARIEPQEGLYDEKEIAHYRDVIDCCAKNHITPIVTLHHFSSPAWLMGKGGWASPYVADAFARYTENLLTALQRELPYICTINEANMGFQIQKVVEDMQKAMQKEGSIQVGLNTGASSIELFMEEQATAFGCAKDQLFPFLAARTQQQEVFVMQAHQKACAAVRKVLPQAKVGLTLSLFDYQPTPTGEDQARRLWEEDFGFYLPFIRTDDFLGVQNYSRKIVTQNGAEAPAPDAPLTQMGYEDYPASIGHVLRKVAQEFPGELLVTENGIATQDDARRCQFIREAYTAVRDCARDGLPVTGYCYWSLLDNFEWQAGFGKTFGLIAVDRITQIRTPKDSLRVLGELAKKG